MILLYFLGKNRLFGGIEAQSIIRNLLVALFILFLTSDAFAQEQLEIRKKIIPLRTNRNDVEKIARLVNNFSDFVRYETDKEFIDVNYSQSECVGHGWNVPTNRVLTFRSYPKNDLMLENVIKTNKSLFKIVSDNATNYFVNQSDGVVFVVSQGNPEKIEYLIFSPLPSDSNLRCKGFPEYSLISSYYAPLATFTIKDVTNWDVGLIYNVLHRVKENSDLKGYIFIYCKKGGENKCRELQSKVEKYVFKVSKLNSTQMVVIRGGNRNNIEIETFLIPKDNPPPVAQPLFPSEF